LNLEKMTTRSSYTDKRLKLNLTIQDFFFDLSSCYSRTNRLEQAIVALDTAIMLDDTYAAFFSNRGLFNYKLHRWSNAISDLENAVGLDSTNWIFYANLALAYKSDDNLDHACRAFKSATRLDLI
jgi:tetratricopeptide (TPR) repeat protein